MARLRGVVRHAVWLIAAAAILFQTPRLHAEASPAGWHAAFAHPVLGPDHVVAMVTVGRWGPSLGQPAVWLLPVVIPS